QSYGDNVTVNGTYTSASGNFSVAGTTILAADTTVSAGNITFTGVVDASTTQGLTANSNGTTRFNATVGGTTARTTLTTDVNGTSTLKSVNTTSDQTYGDNTTSLNG